MSPRCTFSWTIITSFYQTGLQVFKLIRVPLLEQLTAIAVSARRFPNRGAPKTGIIVARIIFAPPSLFPVLIELTRLRAEWFIAFVPPFISEFDPVEIRLVLALLISLVLLHQNAQRVLVIDRCHGIVQFLVVLLLHSQHLLRIFSMTIIASRFPDSGVIVSIATSRVIRVIRGAEAGVRRETLFFRGVSIFLKNRYRKIFILIFLKVCSRNK